MKGTLDRETIGAEPGGEAARPRVRIVLLGIPLVALLIVGLLVWHFRRDREEAIEQRAEELLTIADLKTSEIRWWLQEQVKDGYAFFGEHLGRIAEEILSPTDDRGGAARREQMSASFLDWMSTLVERSDYAAAGLVDSTNRLLISAPSDGAHVLRSYLESVPDAHSRSGVRVLPMRSTSAGGGRRYLGVHVTIIDEPHSCVVCLLDPADVLDKRLRFWPTQTDTGETLLVRRDGDEVVFLNNLRHRPGAALTLRLPVEDEDLPAALAAKGQEGFLRGTDYRGVPVFAAVRSIPETGWFLVAKMDEAEAMAPYREHVIPTALASFSVLAVAALFFLSVRSRVRMRDLRLRNELESRLAQSQRIESVGRLAGGIAHDFNNLLTVIGGFASIVAMDLERDHHLQAQLSEIGRATRRASDLVRQLLAFSRRQVLEPEVLDLNGVLRDMDQMLRRLIAEDVLLRTALAPDLPPVLADPAQVEQVIVNLVVNARDAMPRGGRIDICTENVDLEPDRARDLDVSPGHYVGISVDDTGEGMSEEVRTRIFEPFFTTKEPGKGTGLGLSTVYGILKQSHGALHVRSEEGRGTKIQALLPAADGRLARPKRNDAAEETRGGSETILVAEDEPGVREFVAEVLAGVGYRLLQASDGREAAELSREHRGRIDLLLTDVVMPGLGGVDLYEGIVAEHDGLRVLYMSGYADMGTPGHHELPPGVPLLKKPFSADDLMRRVRGVLDSR